MAEIQGLEITFEAPPVRTGSVEEYTDLLATWAQEQFRRLAFISQEYAYVKVADLHEAPDRPENGMIILADGADFDPGTGAGFYGRKGDAWERLSSTYTYPVWAEDNGILTAATYQWSFGNGANTPNSGGISIYVPTGWTCEVVAMSLRVGGGTATIELVKNGVLQGTAAQVVLSSGQGVVAELATPLVLADGDYINFYTTTVAANVAPNVATAWIRMTKT